MATKKALTDIAYDIMTETGEAMSFKNIWEQVLTVQGKASDISQFYTDMMLDSRFVNLNNVWDLKKKHTFAETFVDLEQLDLDDDEEEEMYDEDEEGDSLGNREEEE